MRNLGIPFIFMSWAMPAVAQSTGDARIHALSSRDGYQAANYGFLADAVASRSIVQLGESIHLTDEFPRVRLNIVRYLHETLGFNTIAFEGSAVNAWLAMETLYASPRDSAAVGRAQEIAWFPLWDTEAMREVMRYIAGTQPSGEPLYLTSFDMQAGQSRSTGARVFEQLFAALGAYERPPRDAATWSVAFSEAKQCAPTSRRRELDRALAQFDAWVLHLAPIVSVKRPSVHVAALRRLPQNISQLASLCEVARASHVQGARQIARDSIAALNVLALRDSVAPGRKIILWAHQSHVYYNTLRYPLPSMGQRLRAADSSSVYTVGLFAGHGSVLDVNDNDRIPLARVRLARSTGYTAENALEAVARAHHATGLYVDLSRFDSAEAPAFFARGATRLELTGKRPAVLARDFDGAVYVDVIHPPHLLFGGPMLGAAALLKGIASDDGVAILVFVGVGAIVVVVARQRRLHA